MKVKKHISENVPPKQLLKEIIDGNKEYRSENREQFSLLREKQNPDITLVTCCDSRVPYDIFGIDSLNEVFIIRNIGNQFRHSEGSIKYSLFHLKTPLLVVMGHTGCGAIQAALGDYREEDDAVQKEVVGLNNSIRVAKERGVDTYPADDPVFINSMYSEINVDHQITKVTSEFNIKPLIKTEKLSVVGMVFDIHGIYGEDSAHFHITNVNGCRDVEMLRKLPLFEKLSDVDKRAYIKRLVK